MDPILQQILEMLKIDKLDEDDQKQIKEKLETIIETKVTEQIEENKEKLKSESEEKFEKEKLSLNEQYEEKFEEYKEDIITKFSAFVDGILEEELQIPDELLEHAKHGKLYADLIEQFKIRLAIDEDKVDEEIKGMMREAKEKIGEQRDEIDSLTGDKLNLQVENQKLKAQIYIHEKCEGLTSKQSNTVMTMLEGEIDTDRIDKKFETIVENLKGVKEQKDDYSCKCDCGYEGGSDKVCSASDCPECGKKMKDAADGKGKAANEEIENEMHEDKNKNPFSMRMEQYVKKINETSRVTTDE